MKITDKQIIKALKAGKSIKRKVWQEGYVEEYVIDYDSYCNYFVWHEESKYGCMLFRLNDIEANDWEIV